jgi:mRNA interferase RelE/StbE
VKYEVRLSRRAERDLDRLDQTTRRRVVRRLDQLAEDPFASHLSAPLTGTEGLRKSRLGGWRIVFEVTEDRIVFVVIIERRGQVYQRI